MNKILEGKKILITGGAGSVGSALTKELLKYNPAAIRILDISENEMFQMRKEFSLAANMRYLIGDIRDAERLKLAMEDIDIVVHLAAMKHVYACEYNPFEAIKTNIDGLQNVINVARNAGVKKVIFSSTDKAAAPSNVMGMTKLLGEKLISLANYYMGGRCTVFSSIRFGNVIGSNGSVVPLFRKQLSAGKALTITDKEMTRFVITMKEAVNLIYSAVRLAKGGETFVWKMRTLKVTDLANSMIQLYSPKTTIKTKVIGKGEGEKIHEEIMSDDELSRAVELDNLYVIFPTIDHLNVKRKYNNDRRIKKPVIRSSDGEHMSIKEITQLIKIFEVENAKNFIN